ncbi:MAG: hypothetical protein A2297_00215 [Elusimicrobia bacterium RIFOXYB2_FULL_48_7]|nr:MAG: hypothetical protein A2297_00215 [Elusimicrobia bacterium RIFOXYB2_FULL_48_7]
MRNTSDPKSAGVIISNTSNTITTNMVIKMSTEGYSNINCTWNSAYCQNSDLGKQVNITGTGNIGSLQSFNNWYVEKFRLFFVNSSSSIPQTGALTISGGTMQGKYLSVKNLGGGARDHWDNGDTFVISNGYPCIDQIGRGPGPIGSQPSQPLYEWNNTLNGTVYHIQPNSNIPSYTKHIKANREYYACSNMSDAVSRGMNYTPYTYPHPLQFVGVTVDVTSPAAPGAVYDGTGADVSATFSTASLSANWTPGIDNESGIKGYIFAAGTSAGASNIVGWTTLGNVQSTTTYKTLSMGVTYYFSVKAVNGIDLISATSANSNGQYVAVDGTPPSAPVTVRDGTGVDISSTISAAQLYANWDAGGDAESGISGYKYAIGTSAGATDTSGWASNSGTSVLKTGLSLSIGATYYFTVKSVNGAGLESALAANSNGVVVVSTADVTAPIPPSIVRDGAATGVDISSSMSLNTLSANWAAGSDPESGITGYQYAIGTSAGGTNTAAWTAVGNVLSATRSGLALAAGATYYFSVKSVNGNNLVSATAANSNGQYIVAVDTGDATPPLNITAVRDGTGADITATTVLTEINANWDPSADAESGIARYWYAIGTTAGGTEFVPWTDNGQLTGINVTGVTMTEGVTYYISVKAENNVGLQSASTTTSNGQVALPPAPPDTVPPVISLVTAGGITGTGAAVTWVTDEPSTSLVEYGRSAAYSRQTLEDASLDLSHSAALTELMPGTVYHFRVISRDASGNETASSDYTFSTEAPAQPIAGYIHAYPNPCKVSVSNPAKFRMDGATVSEASIYTVSGRLIRKLTGNSAEISWDGTNTDGQKVGRGIYIYKITGSSGDSVTGKIALTK